MQTYIITPLVGETYEVQGDKYQFDKQSGRHLIYKGEELIANLLNVSVRRKQTAGE